MGHGAYLGPALLSFIAGMLTAFALVYDRWHSVYVDVGMVTVGMRASCTYDGCEKANFGHFGAVDSCPDRSADYDSRNDIALYLSIASASLAGVGAILALIAGCAKQQVVMRVAAAVLLLAFGAHMAGGMFFHWTVTSFVVCGTDLCAFVTRTLAGRNRTCTSTLGLSMMLWALGAVLSFGAALIAVVLAVQQPKRRKGPATQDPPPTVDGNEPFADDGAAGAATAGAEGEGDEEEPVPPEGYEWDPETELYYQFTEEEGGWYWDPAHPNMYCSEETGEWFDAETGELVVEE